MAGYVTFGDRVRMSIERLSPRTFHMLGGSVRRPRYDRARTTIGIVHLGVGAFMRSHVAVYCDDAMEAESADWGIAGVSLRRPDVRELLAPQNGLYTVGEFDASGERRRLVGALKSVHTAPEDPRAVLRLLADPAVRVITLTVTERATASIRIPASSRSRIRISCTTCASPTGRAASSAISRRR